jgi:hypothetical protein
MSNRRIALALTLAIAVPAAHACGPMFAADLLSDRARTLSELPEGEFAFEVQRLVSPAPQWTVVERGDWIHPSSTVTRDSIEQEWWGDRHAAVAALRESPDARAAWLRSEGLPDEVRRYIAGAIAFENDDLDDATRRFASVLELAPEQRAHYGVWAQYMLGRIAALREDSAAASPAFAATRQLVADGADDPLGLAATSLGDEAKLKLDAGDDVGAIALYAQQAATGSQFGRTSLLQVARALLRDKARLDRVIADPLGQRLVVAYLLTRSGELSESPIDADADDAAPAPPIDPAARITRVLDAVERAGIDHVAGADRLAALAYRSGRYDLAARLAAIDPGALSWWVRAKLALRAGDVAAAADAYARAAQAFPRDESWGSEVQAEVGVYETTRPQCRVEGERGTLALARGEFVAAMDYLYRSANEYWADAAFVAERVLTLDELKAFVDAHVPPAPGKVEGESDVEGVGWNRAAPATELRALLARRLMRAERFDEALRYFDDSDLKTRAQKYVEARRATGHGGRIEQAQAWYAAASAAREDGMQVLGYELDPDYAYFGGDFADIWAPQGEAAKASTLPIALIGAEEITRSTAAAATPPLRFHYRYTAATFAGRAADLVPARSQAFAAILCHATGWLLNRDPETAQKIYLRYLREGPYVDWGESFGQECPAPDFAGAAERLHVERVAAVKHALRKAMPWGGSALLCAGLLILVWRLRRKRLGGGA